MKYLLLIAFSLIIVAGNGQSKNYQKYAIDTDTIIDNHYWKILHYMAEHGLKWTELQPVDVIGIDNLQYHRNKVFFYFDSLLWVNSRDNFCDSNYDADKTNPCKDSVVYYMNYWNAIIEKQEKWLFIDNGKNVLGSFPERPLSGIEQKKMEAFFNRKH